MVLLIPSSSYTRYGLEDYLCSSDDNDFIPVNSLCDGERIIIKSGKTERTSFNYSLIAPTFEEVSITRKITTFCQALGIVRPTPILMQDAIIKYVATYGSLVYYQEQPFKLIPLVVLAVKKRYLFSLERNNLNPSHFCLLIDKKCITDDKHFKLYRNVKKHYIDLIGDIDIMYCTNLTQVCYKERPISLPKFKSITEMTEHLDSINELIHA